MFTAVLMDYLTPLHIACMLLGAGVGIAGGTWCRNHMQITDGPAHGAVIGAVAFWYAAFYIRWFLLVGIGGAVLYFFWRQRAGWMPMASPLLRNLTQPLIQRFHRRLSIEEELRAEQDSFDDATEAMLSQNLPPEVKQRMLEELEIQHNDRITAVLRGNQQGDRHAS